MLGAAVGQTGAADTAMQRPSRQMVGGQAINCPDLLECAWGESRALAGREGKFRRVGFILQIRGEGSVSDVLSPVPWEGHSSEI